MLDRKEQVKEIYKAFLVLLDEALIQWLSAEINDQQFTQKCGEAGQWMVDLIGKKPN